MDKDEMKNKISIALKDPILQQGFEIICKDLETEKKLNEEIKARFVKCNTCTDEMKSKCLMFSENLCQGERCEELVDLISLINKTELEKENAELKELMKSEHEIEARKNNRLISRLIKAKEIIQLMLIYQEGLSSMGELKREAEQFINEVINDKEAKSLF